MRKALLLAALLLGCSHLAPAQSTNDTPKDDPQNNAKQDAREFPRYEFFVGYSRLSADADQCPVGLLPDGSCVGAPRLDEREGINGVEGSVARNFNRYFGLKGDFSAHTRAFTATRSNTFTFAGTTFFDEALVSHRQTLYQLMGGPEFKLRNRTRATPFGYLLFGAARGTDTEKLAFGLAGPEGDVRTFGGAQSTHADTKPAGAVGGGLDVRVSGRASVRSSFDYNATYLNAPPFGGLGQGRQNNFRTSVGILFH